MSASSTPSADPARELGRRLTGTEAREIADRLADGDTLTGAVGAAASGHRPAVRGILARLDPPARTSVLRAIEGARSTTTAIDPLWTMPGHLARTGPLTSSVARLVAGARHSITCSTFNFQRTSGLWTALHAAAQRPGLTVRVYLDRRAADHHPSPSTPTTREVARHLQPATVLRTRGFDGGPVRNHAKFLAVDHRFLIVTSANFSWSAEHGNVELGLLADNVNLVQAIESEMRRAEDAIYEQAMP